MAGKVVGLGCYRLLYAGLCEHYVISVQINFISYTKEGFEQAIACVQSNTLEKVQKNLNSRSKYIMRENGGHNEQHGIGTTLFVDLYYKSYGSPQIYQIQRVLFYNDFSSCSSSFCKWSIWHQNSLQNFSMKKRRQRWERTEMMPYKSLEVQCSLQRKQKKSGRRLFNETFRDAASHTHSRTRKRKLGNQIMQSNVKQKAEKRYLLRSWQEKHLIPTMEFFESTSRFRYLLEVSLFRYQWETYKHRIEGA